MITVVLVTGGRTYDDQAHVYGTLDAMAAHYGELLIVHGNAGGADNLARAWALSRGMHRADVPALWGKYKSGAGPKRNAAMLALRPHVCVGFPGGNGTADMLVQARAAGVPTYEV